MDILTLLVIALIVFQVLDVYTTRKVLSQGGRELNPILAPLMEKFGVDKTLFFNKAIFIAFILYFFNAGTLDLTFMVIVNVIYALVVIHNFRQFKK